MIMSLNIGLCMTMCPSEEVIMREKERLLHPLEILPGTEKYRIPKADPQRIIKQYNRSAAGIDLTKPQLLRPPEVLYKTIKYLLNTVMNDKRFSLRCIYDFITNRLRSISQDMVIQSLQPHECIRLYEPIVKFHTLFGYRLCEEKLANYDPVLNKKQLMEYLKRLLVCYDTVYQTQCNENNLVERLERLSVDSTDIERRNIDRVQNKINENRPIIESIYILTNLGDTNTYLRFFTIPDIYKTAQLKVSFDIAINHLHGNFVRVCHLSTRLDAISLSAFALQMPTIRRQALQIMSIAYSSKQLLYPVDNLTNILLFHNNNSTENECLHYSIEVSNNNIRFHKDRFNNKSALIPQKKLAILDERLKKEVLIYLE